MALLKGMQSKLSGSAGSITFRRNSGRTIVSEKVTDVKATRTEPQSRQRSKWSNIIKMYRVIRPMLDYGFETKAQGVSDYNMFVKVNMQQTPVYLTKQQVAGGACVAAPYQVTQGSLPAIVISGDGQSAVTDISLGSDNITASTTIAQFSKAVVDNNADYKYGDQISYFLVKQKVNADTGIPYCQFFACSVVLDAANTTDKLWDVVFKNGFTSQDGCLGHGSNDGDCVYCWVHSRKSTNGKTLVSSQQFINANTKLSDYTSETAYDLSSSSYGSRKQVFLTPDADSVSSPASDSTPSGGGGDSL